MGPSYLSLIEAMQTVSLTAKLSAIFAGAIASLILASLAVEDQRLFLACKAQQQTTDACLVKINGR